jgi:hypothetical protein
MLQFIRDNYIDVACCVLALAAATWAAIDRWRAKRLWEKHLETCPTKSHLEAAAIEFGFRFLARELGLSDEQLGLRPEKTEAEQLEQLEALARSAGKEEP